MIGGSPVQPYYELPQSQPTRPGILPQRRQQSANTKTNQTQTTAGATGRVRMQADDPSPSVPPLRMPSPEQLGVGPTTRATETDWTAVRKRMEALTVSSFHLQKLDGGFRFTCVVPVAGERRKIEADGLTEAEAIDLALTRAEARRGG